MQEDREGTGPENPVLETEEGSSTPPTLEMLPGGDTTASGRQIPPNVLEVRRRIEARKREHGYPTREALSAEPVETPGRPRRHSQNLGKGRAKYLGSLPELHAQAEDTDMDRAIDLAPDKAFDQAFNRAPVKAPLKALLPPFAKPDALAETEEVCDQLVDPLSVQVIQQCMVSSHDGDARIYRQVNRDDYCYDVTTARWHKYVGPYWDKDSRCESMVDGIDKVKAVYSDLPSALAREGKTISESATKLIALKIGELSKVPYKKYILEAAAAGKEGLGVNGDSWDSHPELLACTNGVVDLRTGTLMPGSPDLYLRCHTNVRYHSERTEIPRFMAFLESVFKCVDPAPEVSDFKDDPATGRNAADLHAEAMKGYEEYCREYTRSIVGYMKRLFGYALRGSTPEHKLFVLYGKGRNGKGVLMELMNSILGSYAASVPPEIFLKKTSVNSSGPSPDILNLQGKRFAWASETNEGCYLDAAAAKRLVGGDTLTGRGLYAKDYTQFPPSHTIFLMTNYKPSAPADDYALWERIVLIPFKVSFEDNPQEGNPAQQKLKADMGAALSTEKEGILRWMVEGYQEYLREGLNPPEAIRRETKEYRDEVDILGQFLEACCEVGLGKEHRVRGDQFYRAFRNWAEENGHKFTSQKTFGSRMKLRIPNNRGGGGVLYYGVRIIDPGVNSSSWSHVGYGQNHFPDFDV